MNTQHSEGETVIEPKDDYASLVATFLCQARNPEEVELYLRLLNLDLKDLGVTFVKSIRERISCEPSMASDTKEVALNTLNGHLALRELSLAAA